MDTLYLYGIEMHIAYSEFYVSGSPSITIKCTETSSTYTTNSYEHSSSLTWISYKFNSPISLTENYTYLITSIQGNYSV